MWNVKIIKQGKLDFVGAEMSRLNIDIFGTGKLKWVISHQRIIKFSTTDQENHKRNEIAIIVNKRESKSVLRYALTPNMIKLFQFKFKGK